MHLSQPDGDADHQQGHTRNPTDLSLNRQVGYVCAWPFVLLRVGCGKCTVVSSFLSVVGGDYSYSVKTLLTGHDNDNHSTMTFVVQ